MRERREREGEEQKKEGKGIERGGDCLLFI